MCLITCLSAFSGFCQVDIRTLPVNVVTSVSHPDAPLVLYLTGDGGWNKFSQALTKEMATKGYPVVSLNSNKFFWQKKSPAQIAAAIAALVKNYQKQWNRNKFLLVGYSFGADVMAFAYNQLPKDLASQVENITLLSPSLTTDFEIHIIDMLGNKSGGQSVPASINKITDIPIVILFGEDEKDFRNSDLTGKNILIEKIAGDHHYDGNEANVVNKIIQHVPKR